MVFVDYDYELWLNFGLDNYWYHGCIPNDWDYEQEEKDDDVLVRDYERADNGNDDLFCDYEQADNGNDVQVGLRAWWCSLARSWITTSPTPSSQRKGQPYYQTKPLVINIYVVSPFSSTVYTVQY
jgi:hypothetical protein